jgi:hypothetical protein
MPTNFKFEGIYSNGHDIHHDNIHGDTPINGRVPTHNIKYYFNDEKHPIIFLILLIMRCLIMIQIIGTGNGSMFHGKRIVQ